MTTTSHRDCTHPATKAARAKCRKDRAAQVKVTTREIDALVDSYYRDEADAETIIAALRTLGIDIDPEADLDTIIASIR